MRFCRHPPPRPRLRRSSPAPSRGAWAVRGDIRGAAVSGVEPAGNRIWGGAGGKPYPGWSRREIVSGVEPAGNRIRGGADGKPCPGLLRDLPMCWTVGISPRGEGPTGRGNLFPLPCLPHSNHLTSRWHPLPAPSCRLSIRSLPAAPPRPHLRQGDTHTLSAGNPHPRPSLSREGRAISGGQPCGRLLPRLSPRT